MMKNLIEKVANRVVDGEDTHWEMNIYHFDWVPGVGLYGIYKAYKATNNRKYYDFLIDWSQRHLKEAYDNNTVNSTAPLMTVADLYKERKDPAYRKVMTEIAEYIITKAPLTKEGGLEHTVTERMGQEGFRDQIWADTLFMCCLFLAKLGKITGEKKYSDFAVNQFLIHHKCLSDGKGLYFHGYNGAQKNHMSSVRWGRANAWILLSSMELIDILGEFEGKNIIIENVARHCKELKKLQKEDGGFGTILDDLTSYTEMSATAGIIAGMIKAAKTGIIDEAEFKPAIERGIQCVKDDISSDGSVMHVSSGTPVMPDADGYRTIKVMPTLYGQALTIAMLTA